MSSTDDTRTAAVAASGWGYPVRFFQPGNPAFWVYLFLVGTGAFLYYGVVMDAAVYPTGTVLALALCVLYTLPFVWFITRRDRSSASRRSSRSSASCEAVSAPRG